MRARLKAVDFVRLVVPVVHQPLVRPTRDLASVKKQHKTLVGGNVDLKFRRAAHELLAEPHGVHLALRRSGVRDPDPVGVVRRLDPAQVHVSAREPLFAEHLPHLDRLRGHGEDAKCQWQKNVFACHKLIPFNSKIFFVIFRKFP